MNEIFLKLKYMISYHIIDMYSIQLSILFIIFPNANGMTFKFQLPI